MSATFIIDAHLDLAMNAMEWNRDLVQPLAAIRQREMHMKDKPGRGRGTVCLPELRKGRVGLVVATQLSRFTPYGSSLPGWHSQQQAWAMTQAQLAWYREMEALGEMVQVRDIHQLEIHLALTNLHRFKNYPDIAKSGLKEINYVYIKYYDIESLSVWTIMKA